MSWLDRLLGREPKAEAAAEVDTRDVDSEADLLEEEAAAERDENVVDRNPHLPPGTG
jgi:hypothetical protein